MVNVRKRGSGYQYYFEGNRVNGKRTQIVKSGFKTKSDAQKEGMIAYNDYYQTGSVFKPSQMLYSEFLDLWIEKYCKINLKYHTIEAYSNIIKNPPSSLNSYESGEYTIEILSSNHTQYDKSYCSATSQ